MTYELTVVEKPGYLHFIVTGQNSLETVKGYLEEILRECIVRRSSRILIEERLVGPRLGTVDVFMLVSSASRDFKGHVQSMAVVDVYAVDDNMEFAEKVVQNREGDVRVLYTVAAAEEWMQSVVARDAG